MSHASLVPFWFAMRGIGNRKARNRRTERLAELDSRMGEFLADKRETGSLDVIRHVAGERARIRDDLAGKTV